MLRNCNQSFGGKRLMYRCSTGVRGDAIPAPAPGAVGPGWMFNSIGLPLDATAEFRFWILDHDFPAGVLPPDDFGSIDLGVLPDGIYTATVELRRFDLYLGAFAVVLIVGSEPGYSEPVQDVEFMRPPERIGSFKTPDGVTP